jgi:hypothetical protein
LANRWLNIVKKNPGISVNREGQRRQSKFAEKEKLLGVEVGIISPKTVVAISEKGDGESTVRKYLSCVELLSVRAIGC